LSIAPSECDESSSLEIAHAERKIAPSRMLEKLL
jgi:hypothetical protein